MFAPLYGVPEDPATGSANVTLIGLLAHRDPRPTSRCAKTIGQGFDMGRPSVLEATAEKKAGKVVATYIGGRCVPMLSGTIELIATDGLQLAQRDGEVAQAVGIGDRLDVGLGALQRAAQVALRAEDPFQVRHLPFEVHGRR